MFNAKSLLDALISAGTPGRRQGRTAPGQGGLGGMLGGLAEQVQKAGGVGGLAGMAGQILGQATQGVGDAARQTGVQQKAGDALNQATGGRSPQDILAQAAADVRQEPGHGDGRARRPRRAGLRHLGRPLPSSAPPPAWAASP